MKILVKLLMYFLKSVCHASTGVFRCDKLFGKFIYLFQLHIFPCKSLLIMFRDVHLFIYLFISYINIGSGTIPVTENTNHNLKYFVADIHHRHIKVIGIFVCHYTIDLFFQPCLFFSFFQKFSGVVVLDLF